MELSWPMRLRIMASVGTGVILVGILGWRLVEPAEPLGPVYYGTITGGGGMFLLGVFCGFDRLFRVLAVWQGDRHIGRTGGIGGSGVAFRQYG